MATAFVRLSQSFAGSLSPSNCRTWPLFGNSIRRQSCSRKVRGLFSLLECSSSGRSSELFGELADIRPSVLPKFQRRIECSASSGAELEGSAFYSASVAVQEASDESVAVVTPLCERPATHVTCLEDLLQWRRKAELLAVNVGSEFLEADGGPDAGDLLRELEWLLDDAVAARCRRRGRKGAGCWLPCSWRDVKSCLPVETVPSLDSTSGSAFSADASLELGVLGTILKDRYTDPVAELAADGAAGCCDSLRDSFAQNLAPEDHQDSPSSSSATFPTLLDDALQNQSTNAHLLLRSSIGELDHQWTQRVKDRRPFQYVVGCTHWRDLVLSVQEGALIPRPETEQMIDLAEAAIAAENSLGDGVWADLGTGSGALAIALARLLPPTGSVIAIDANETAVAVARRNVNQYGLSDRVKVVSGSWFSPLENYNGSLAGVLSNPPYIPSANIPGLQAEVGKHEPRSALDGGEDGMKDLRIICQGSSRALRSGGFLALETNGGKQAEAVSDLLLTLRTVGGFQTNAPVPCFKDIRIIPDFAGIMRFVVATRC